MTSSVKPNGVSMETGVELTNKNKNKNLEHPNLYQGEKLVEFVYKIFILSQTPYFGHTYYGCIFGYNLQEVARSKMTCCEFQNTDWRKRINL